MNAADDDDDDAANGGPEDASASEEPEEEELPFALPDATASSLGRKESNNLRTSSGIEHSCHSSSSAYLPPGLSSSLVSSPTTTDYGEQSRASSSDPASSSLHGSDGRSSSSLFQPHFLDAAASILHPASSLFNLSLISTRGSHNDHTSAEEPSEHRGSCDQHYGDTTSSSQTTIVPEIVVDDNHGTNSNWAPPTGGRAASSLRLPVLPEERSVTATSELNAKVADASVHDWTPRQEARSTITSPSSSCREMEWLPCTSSGFGEAEGRSSPSQDAPPQQQSASQTIVPAATTNAVVGSTSHSLLPFLWWLRTAPSERRLATLAGATATRTGPCSFDVSLDLSASCQSVPDVMDVLGNPELLRLWCDALPPEGGFVITQRSEGSVRSWQSNHLTSNPAEHSLSPSPREYEGEWVEATTAPLIVPPRTGCFYSAGRAVSGALGCPAYGRITMFVERQRGQVGLTLGPFPGNVQVWYKLRIEPTSYGRIRVINQVRVERGDALSSSHGIDPTSSATMCGLWEALERFLLPTIDDYMDQVLSSTARLRFLVENGESYLYNTPETPPSHHHCHGVATAPLLSTVA